MNIHRTLIAVLTTMIIGVAHATPLTRSQAPQGMIKGQYIVTFNKTAQAPKDLASTLAKSHGGKVLHIYESALRGFAVSIPETASTAFVEAMKKNPNVLSVEPDVVMSIHTSTQNNAV